MPSKRLIDCYPYRIKNGVPEFLLFKRAGSKIYAGQWRMVGGKVKEGETRWEGALRELKEETGLTPIRFWTIPSINTFYEPKSDAVHQIPAFAAELSADDKPLLDEEHTGYVWLDASEAVDRVPWPEQKRLILLSDNIIRNDQILEDWLISSD